MTPGVLGVRTCDPAGATGEDPVMAQGRGSNARVYHGIEKSADLCWVALKALCLQDSWNIKLFLVQFLVIRDLLIKLCSCV